MKRTRILVGLLAAIAICCLAAPAALWAGKGGGNGGGGKSGGGAPPPTPVNYAISYFGPLTGGTSTIPSAMNNNTEVVGYCEIDGWPHAFVYSSASKTIVDLNDQFRADGLAPPDGEPLAFDSVAGTGWLVAWAMDINDSGQIVCVLACWNAGDGVAQYLTRYTPASSVGTARLDILDLPPEAGWAFSNWSAINNNGDVVGGGYLWTDAHVDPASGWLTANSLPHGAGDVNDEDGSGWVQIIGDNHRYTVNVGTLDVTDDFDLGTLFPRSKDTIETAASINNSGDVAGYSQDWGKPFQVIQHGYRYRDSEGLIDLGTLGGATSGVDDMNSYGDIIGISDTSAGDFHVFLYSNAFGGMTDLSTALPDVTLTATSGNGSGVIAINDVGQILGSYGGAYILTPQP